MTIIALVMGLSGVAALVLYKKNTGWGSFATHIDDFAAALKCWIHNPVLGCGFNTEAPIREYMSEFNSQRQKKIFLSQSCLRFSPCFRYSVKCLFHASCFSCLQR